MWLIKRKNLVEVVIKSDYNKDYAYLTGRWYISPSGTLMLEAITEFYCFGNQEKNFYSEKCIREISGEYCK